MRTVCPGTVFSTVASLRARALGHRIGRRARSTVTYRVIRSSTWWVPARKAARASSRSVGSTWVR